MRAETFGFNASAVAFGGLIAPPEGRKVISRPINAVGAVALAPTGGFNQELVEEYDEHGVKIGFARTAVRGEQLTANTFRTTTTLIMQGLDLPGLLHVDTMAAEIVSERRLGRQPDPDARFTITASIAGLKIATNVFKAPALDLTVFREGNTYDSLVEKLKRNPEPATAANSMLRFMVVRKKSCCITERGKKSGSRCVDIGPSTGLARSGSSPD